MSVNGEGDEEVSSSGLSPVETLVSAAGSAEGLISLLSAAIIKSTRLTLRLQEDHKTVVLNFLWPLGGLSLGASLGIDSICPEVVFISDLCAELRSWPPNPDRLPGIAFLDQGENEELIDEFIFLAFRHWLDHRYLQDLEVKSYALRDVWVRCLEAAAAALAAN